MVRVFTNIWSISFYISLQSPAPNIILKLISFGCTGYIHQLDVAVKIKIQIYFNIKNFQETECLKNSHKNSSLPEIDVLQDFESGSIEDENIEKKNYNNHFVNKENSLQLSKLL